MSTLWIIAIALILIFIWLWMQPKQGTRASNAPRRQTLPDAHPSGDEQEENPAITTAMPQNRAALPARPPLSEAEIHQLLASGQKIAAIKRVRDVNHWGLKEAKEYVEALERDGSSSLPTPQMTADPTPPLRQEVQRLLAANQKVSAVKLVRDQTHWSLQKAKQYVDTLQAEDAQAMDRTLSNALSDPTLQKEIQHLLATHQKFAAIKRIRSLTGCGLSQAMDYVERVERQQPPEP